MKKEQTKEVRISIGTIAGMKNERKLDISTNDWGIIRYSLYGRKSRIPFSLSNLQIGWKYKCELPKDIDKYDSIDKLIEDVKYCIDSGVESMTDIIYAKQRGLNKKETA